MATGMNPKSARIALDSGQVSSSESQRQVTERGSAASVWRKSQPSGPARRSMNSCQRECEGVIAVSARSGVLTSVGFWFAGVFFVIFDRKQLHAFSRCVNHSSVRRCMTSSMSMLSLHLEEHLASVIPSCSHGFGTCQLWHPGWAHLANVASFIRPIPVTAQRSGCPWCASPPSSLGKSSDCPSPQISTSKSTPLSMPSMLACAYTQRCNGARDTVLCSFKPPCCQWFLVFKSGEASALHLLSLALRLIGPAPGLTFGRTVLKYQM